MFIHTCGPHTALIKSSSSANKFTDVVIGGRIFALPILERVDSLDLRLRTIEIKTNQSMTLSGVPVSVLATVQTKIQGWTSNPDNPDEMVMDESSIRLAAQHFLGKKESEINDAIQWTVAGHQRAIVSSLTVEQLYRDRAIFSKRVFELCDNDLRGMGVAIASFTVAEISDESDYIRSLGVTQTERVKREALEGASLHRSKAKAFKAEMDTKAHLKENAEKERRIGSFKQVNLRIAESRKEVQQAKAVQRKASAIKNAEMTKAVMVTQQQAEAKRVEMERVVDAINVDKEKLLKIAQVSVKADAEFYRKKREAEILSINAEVEGWSIRQKGDAEAEVIRARGKAEADILEERVRVWMDNASVGAVMDRLVDVLPEVAHQIAKPLGNTSKLVFVGDGATEYDDERGDEELVAAATDGGKELEEWTKNVNMDRMVGAFLVGDPDSEDWKQQVANAMAR
eukprot:GFKZ01011591.1.p1 GENE.GFKZ01011591.1~~GFKZ01011591.1.p1  ORF type:complete len:456 (+),score=103.76 GFKZ01011591.1:217-1584(+)